MGTQADVRHHTQNTVFTNFKTLPIFSSNELKKFVRRSAQAVLTSDSVSWYVAVSPNKRYVFGAFEVHDPSVGRRHRDLFLLPLLGTIESTSSLHGHSESLLTPEEI
jgi:hypothetical protein